MVRSETGTKKKPPTFQHLPPNRAKKLKKNWVDIKKIKSKWRTEKRKEGIGGSTSIGQGDHRSDNIPEEESSENPNQDKADEAHDEERVLTPPKRLPARAHSRAEQLSEKPNEDPVRDMTREAYSRASLHTYKSDPLHRNRDRGGSSREVTNRMAGGTGRGRGQPNMKLRMGAMLEKIKRDYS